MMLPESDIAAYRTAIAAAFPELAQAECRLLTKGWHSVAVEVDGRLIFKFPRHAVAEKALLKEASLLAVLRPALTMPVPDLTIHPGAPFFSRHTKLQGDHLVTAQYEVLPEKAPRRLAEQMALFYAELHRVDAGVMARAGAAPVEPWLPPEQILRKALPVLPPPLHAYAERTVEAFQNLPSDPYGSTYGFFDGHGWNMAFDNATQTLNGIYDFADSGFGPLQQEFIYSNFISPDLTARIITGYEALAGRVLDRERIAVLTGVHRLSELAALADDPEHVADMIRHVADWVGRGCPNV